MHRSGTPHPVIVLEQRPSRADGQSVQPLTRLLLAEAIIDSLLGDPGAITRSILQIRGAALAARRMAGLEAASELHLLANMIEVESWTPNPSTLGQLTSIAPDPYAEALATLGARVVSELAGAGVISSRLAQRVTRAQRRIEDGSPTSDTEGYALMSMQIVRAALTPMSFEPVRPTRSQDIDDT